MSKKFQTYEVTLRRDVQQIARILVEAQSRQEAIDVAEAVSNNDAWSIEEHIGMHRPHAQIAPIKGRTVGKTDRRTNTDRRADKRRVGDKSRALAEARRKR